ncbi:hypothetical protein L1987_15588 [Smallanthus sonchifolius]|uniref:Uncharacterized protein n=1 Tax=Smallanthus sonchifolius TaxID=185202 RepID=A0ACB9J838_9ASTR|nr:hypothetical protein L1987_15588 [Smallanthus sonchifolius]
MMATTAVIGLRAGETLLKLLSGSELGFVAVPTKNVITVKKSSNYGHGFIPKRHSQDTRYIRAVKEHVNTASDSSEKQWNLSTETALTKVNPTEKTSKKIYVNGSGKSAHRRRIDAQRKTTYRRCSSCEVGAKKQLKFVISPELLQNRAGGYVKGIASDTLLTHAEVVVLSKKIKIGQRLEERKSRLEERLGSEPSEVQLAASLRISRAELQIKQIECKLAREKLAMSNVRLVMPVAQKYANMGAEIGDLIQGVSKALNENSRTLRVPIHVHERLSAIRHAKAKLQKKGITPSIEYMADDHPENDPWNGVDLGALKDEANKLMTTALREREREIIRLYYGLDNEFLTWEDISRRMGLSREQVRQVGLVALEKLKNAARKTNLDAMLVEH